MRPRWADLDPADQDTRIRDQRCIHCQADGGQPCVGSAGEALTFFHQMRRTQAALAYDRSQA